MERKETWRISSGIVTLYAFSLFCLYPFYYENGYYNMGTAKCKFFLSVSVIAFLVILVTAIVDMIMQKKRINIVINWKKSSVTENLLYVYMIIVLLSFVFSTFKQEVLWGARDWYLGTIPLLLMAFLTYFTIHMCSEQKWLEYGCLIVSEMVFLLGICNRFSFYPVPIEPHYPEFISTLGNINWFCGYMSVISPIGIGLFVLTEDKKYKHKWQKWLLSFYVLTAFITGFCQGSSSVFVWNAALFVTLLWISGKNTARIKRWLLIVCMWGMSGQLVRILKALFPKNYNYDAILIDTNVTLIIAVVAAVLYALSCFYWKQDKELHKAVQEGIRKIVPGAIVICILLGLVLAVYNTNVGISYLKENSLFILDENWGNGRGVIFKVSFELFERMSPLQKLFGVGADGFSAFAYSTPEMQAYLQSYFGESILTNAHCEIITNLINLGILGTVAYIAVFVSFVTRCMKRGETQPLLYIPAVCVICYFANNLISFAQVLNIPFLFLVLGIGEYYLRKSWN